MKLSKPSLLVLLLVFAPFSILYEPLPTTMFPDVPGTLSRLFTPESLRAATGTGPVPADVEMKIHDANSVWLGITNTGQIGLDIIHGNTEGLWPSGTPNNYIFGSGLWIGGLAGLDGDGTKDTVVVYGYDPLSGRSEYREGRVGQDPTDPLTRIFSSTVLEDLLDWPDEFRDGEGTPIVHSWQDFVTIYNDISGDPVFETGRCGIEVKQRSMAFTGGFNSNTILIFYELTNRSDSLPDGPYTLEEAYIGFIADMDIGDNFQDDMTSFLDSVDVYGREKVSLFTAVAWDSNFVEDNFEGDPGFVATFFLQPPGNPWDGVDNDGDGIVDENPFDGVDDDGDDVPDDIPDEVDAVSEFHYTVTSNPSVGPPPSDPVSDPEAYRKLRCLTDEDCGEWDFATDVRFLISCGPFDLPPGESQIAGVAICFANAVGDPEYLELHGDPPRPDPQDSVLTELVATIVGVVDLYESGFYWEVDRFDILGTSILEDTNDASGPYLVYTNIIDSIPLARTTLHYSVDGGQYEEVEMENEALNLFSAEIPGQSFWSTISYYVQAVDSAYQSLRDPEDAPITTYDFSVLDVPDFSSVSCEGCGEGRFIAPADYNLDGLIDLLVTTQGGPILYRNAGDFVFEDVTSAAGLLTQTSLNGTSWGDLDNDGFPDIFIASYSVDTPHILYHNQGDGSFEDVTDLSGISDTVVTTTGVWGDVNGDGLLDLVTAQYGRDRLYVNNGDGKLTESAQEWGIGEDVNDRAAILCDYNGDSHLDLILVGGTRSYVYENIDEDSFVDVTAGSGIADGIWQSVSAGDYDGDGDIDLLCSGEQLTLYENTDGEGSFSDVTGDFDLAGTAGDAAFSDINADGFLDIVMAPPAVLIRKPGEGFVDLTELSGISSTGGNSAFVLPVDLNNNGRLDLVVDDIWRNDAYGGYFPRHWLELSLRGTLSGRSACGAAARVHTGELSMARVG